MKRTPGVDLFCGLLQAAGNVNCPPCDSHEIDLNPELSISPLYNWSAAIGLARVVRAFLLALRNLHVPSVSPCDGASSSL